MQAYKKQKISETMKTRMFIKAGILSVSLVMLIGISIAEAKSVKIVSGYENAADPFLQVEYWMTDDFFWNSGNYEGTLMMEDWMVDEALWKTTVIEGEKETEVKMSLESWMTDESNWNRKQDIAVPDKDQRLEVEPWMISDESWKLPAGK
jgi:hypothetical protein